MDRVNGHAQGHGQGHEETPRTRLRFSVAAGLALVCVVLIPLWWQLGLSASTGDAASAASWRWFGASLITLLTAGWLAWVWRSAARRRWTASRMQVQRLIDVLDVCFWQTDPRHQLSLWRPPLGSPESIWEGAGLVGQQLWDAWQVQEPGSAEAWRARLAARAPVIDLRVRRADRPDGPIWLLRGVARFDSLGRFAGYEGTLRPEAGSSAAAAPVDAASPGAAEPAWLQMAAVLDGLNGPALLLAWRVRQVGVEVKCMNAVAAGLLQCPEAIAAVPALWAGRGAAAAQLDAAYADALDELKLRSSAVKPQPEQDGLCVTRRVCGSTMVLTSLPKLQAEESDEHFALLTLDRASSGAESAALDDQEAFTYAVSHDLRAPLRVVDGFARILKEDYGRVLDRIGNDHLERILGAAGRMSGMIDALLEQAKLSTRPLAREPVNLSQLARFVEDDLRRQHPDRLVDVLIEDGMVVEGDPTLLRTVVDNLLGNAWKYSAKRARARIEFMRQPREGHPGYSVFCVRDNGVGFDMRYAERLFGMFQRLHSANDYQGTGVGLASVRRIVLRHGGEIWAESEVDGGSRFYFTLG